VGSRKTREDPEYSSETVVENVRVVFTVVFLAFSFCSLGHVRLGGRMTLVANGPG
jgi:hypothetical protein